MSMLTTVETVLRAGINPRKPKDPTQPQSASQLQSQSQSQSLSQLQSDSQLQFKSGQSDDRVVGDNEGRDSRGRLEQQEPQLTAAYKPQSSVVPAVSTSCCNSAKGDVGQGGQRGRGMRKMMKQFRKKMKLMHEVWAKLNARQECSGNATEKGKGRGHVAMLALKQCEANAEAVEDNPRPCTLLPSASCTERQRQTDKQTEPDRDKVGGGHTLTLAWPEQRDSNSHRNMLEQIVLNRAQVLK